MMKIDVRDVGIPPEIIQKITELSTYIDFDGLDTKGANGHVFFGLNTLTKQRIAIKFYYWGGQADAFPEPKYLAQVKSPNILPINDAQPLDNNWAFFNTPFCASGDLDQVIQDDPIDVGRAIRITTQILMGASELHRFDLIHRDLKPLNIFKFDAEQFVIGDFGSVKSLSGKDFVVSNSAHSVIYTPPEALGFSTFRRASDLYQIGIILYQLLGGYLPYNERCYLSNAEKIHYNSINDEIDRQLYAKNIISNIINLGRLVRIDTIPLWIPQKIKRVIRKACHISWADRFQRSSDFIVALNQITQEVSPWKVVDGNPGYVGDIAYRIVSAGDVYQVEKRRSGSWKKIASTAGSDFKSAIAYVEKNIR